MSEAADRSIVVTRVVDAPRELVFEAFTAVRHLAAWWGPVGFTTTTRAFEFRVGGVWDFVMTGPDGTAHQEWITWTAIEAPERIALRHGSHRDDPDAFESALTFTPVGEATRVQLRTTFPTRAARDAAIDRSGALEGGRQTLGKLDTYVTAIAREGGRP